MLSMKILNKDIDLDIPIKKDNSILLVNKSLFFQFYYCIYSIIELKNKNNELKIGNTSLDYKNTIIFSFIDYNELLNNLQYKKNTLFYEYIESLFQTDDSLNDDLLLYDLNDKIKYLLTKTNLKIDYNIDIDLLKLVLGTTTFSLQNNITEISSIISNLLENYIKKYPRKYFIIFLNSDFLNINLSIYDNCYSFDLSSSKNIKEYNLLCSKELNEFNLVLIENKLENIWPIEYPKEEIENYVIDYFIKIANHLNLKVSNEQEYLSYILLNKIYDNQKFIDNKSIHIRDNVKSFIDQL